MACNFWEIKYISDSNCEPTSNQQKLAATAAVRKKYVFIVYMVCAFSNSILRVCITCCATTCEWTIRWCSGNEGHLATKHNDSNSSSSSSSSTMTLVGQGIRKNVRNIKFSHEYNRTGALWMWSSHANANTASAAVDLLTRISLALHCTTKKLHQSRDFFFVYSILLFIIYD